MKLMSLQKWQTLAVTTCQNLCYQITKQHSGKSGKGKMHSKLGQFLFVLLIYLLKQKAPQ